MFPKSVQVTIRGIVHDDVWHEQNLSASGLNALIQVQVRAAAQILVIQPDVFEEILPEAAKSSRIRPNWLVRASFDLCVPDPEPMA